MTLRRRCINVMCPLGSFEQLGPQRQLHFSFIQNSLDSQKGQKYKWRYQGNATSTEHIEPFRGTKRRRDEEQIMTSKRPQIKPQTHQQGRTATEERLGKVSKKPTGAMYTQ